MSGALPVCQWWGLPVSGTPPWWDGQPQCPDPHACTRRIACTRKKEPQA